jgi:hypothetical protein
MKKSAFAMTLCLLLGSLSLTAKEFSSIKLWVLENLVRWVKEVGTVVT